MNLTTGHQKIALDLIVESPSNPRKTFSGLTELAESMKKGQLQAILVRPVGTNGSTRAEIVFGHRRYRAAKIAGLDELMCDVRVMSDVEVLEAQLIENLQREGVDPLEEADGFRRLIDDHGYTPEDLAAKINMSKSQVYARLKLCALGPEGREALAADILTASTALLVARVPAPLQREAVEALDPGVDDDSGNRRDALGAREALRILQAKFMLRLSAATWELADSDLVPSAGPCTTCPKRTGNQPELFADVRAVDSCTDPTCFASKRDATWERQKAEAKTAGREVLDAKKAEALFPFGRLSHNSGFVDLDEKDYASSGGKKTFRDRFGKKLDEASIVLARDKEGVVHELVDVKLVKALEPTRSKGGVDFVDDLDDARPARAQDDAEMQEQRAQVAAERAATPAIVAAIVAKAQKKDFDKPTLQGLIAYVRPMSALERVLDRRGFLAAAKDDRDKAEKAFDFAVAKMTPADLRGVLVELLITDRVMDLDPQSEFGAFCGAMKVDVKGAVAKERAAIKTLAKSAETAAATPKAKPAKKPSAKAPAKKASKPKKN